LGGPTPIKIGKPILGGKTENLATNDMYGWKKREHTANHGFEAFPKAAGQKKTAMARWCGTNYADELT
jgi:hypothetical protein